MDPYILLIKRLIDEGVLRTPHIIEAFTYIQRKDFLPASQEERAGIDTPLPLGYGQAISQPYTVAFMLELLMPQKGQTILDIGYGSGWTTALLAYIMGEKGKVYSMEIVPELCLLGKENVQKYDFIAKGIVTMFCEDGSDGLKEHAPFDRILVSASANSVSQPLLSQLGNGGRLVAPIKESIFLYQKKGEQYEGKEYMGFLFVPLVHKII